jgi:hypothetical protein
LIKWKGYSLEEVTWEMERDFDTNFLPSIIEDNDVSRRGKILKTTGHGRQPCLETINCSCITTVEAPRSYKFVNNVKK